MTGRDQGIRALPGLDGHWWHCAALHRLSEAFGGHGDRLGIIQGADPAHPSLVQRSDQSQMGGVLDLIGYPIRPSRLIAMVTVLWVTSIPTLFMFWFFKMA